MRYISSVHFNIVLSMFHFRFTQLQSKAGNVNQMLHPGFCKDPPSVS